MHHRDASRVPQGRWPTPGEHVRSRRSAATVARSAASGRDLPVDVVLFDLLTPEEGRIDAIDATLRFDVWMLAERLIGATDSVMASGRSRGLPIGYFGESTGAAAALIAAARRPVRIAAVVSRGGRPDLARDSLAAVRAPTLFSIGGADPGWITPGFTALRIGSALDELCHVRRMHVGGAVRLLGQHHIDGYAYYV